ncbi:unnamed protein product, partial [Rotaria sp. Silwood2]
ALGEYLDIRLGKNPNPTYGQTVGGYGTEYGYSYAGW